MAAPDDPATVDDDGSDGNASLRQAVSCFLAYLPDGSAVPVTASIDGSDAPPIVRLAIAPLNGTPE